MPHVCILQTSFAKREDTVAFLKEKVPGVRVEFITDSTLLSDVRANGGPSQAVIDRMTLYAKAAEISGADLIVNSCSTVGEVADIYAKEVNVPVMKIDLPMAQEAVTKLIQLGASHINYIPFYPGASPKLAEGIQYAITPDEARYVPEGIPHIVDVGQRQMDSGTLVEIALKLKMYDLWENRKWKAHLASIASNNYNFDELFGRALRL